MRAWRWMLVDAVDALGQTARNLPTKCRSQLTVMSNGSQLRIQQKSLASRCDRYLPNRRYHRYDPKAPSWEVWFPIGQIVCTEIFPNLGFTDVEF
jgi:hypothetical protein